jgi:hypothetical protein
VVSGINLAASFPDIRRGGGISCYLNFGISAIVESANFSYDAIAYYRQTPIRNYL